jgi:hypothetical protein
MFLGRVEKVSEYLKHFSLRRSLDFFTGNALKTELERVAINGEVFIKYTNEFWTSKQRQASSIHEISYRACFKPQLPRFFIRLFTKRGDVVYDPFSGRGTAVIEAGLLGRRVISNDVNPLSEVLARPRFCIPRLKDVRERLRGIPIDGHLKADIDLSMFYHPKTEAEVASLKKYFLEKRESDREDPVDRWIRMVATSRLSGHSKGFFSVYTLPPNLAVSPERQVKINRQRGQRPTYRNTKGIILRKSEALLRNVTERQRLNLRRVGEVALFLQKDARSTAEVESGSVHLTVTSPPFLDVVQYAEDNWLRCWFNSIDGEEVSTRLTVVRTLEKWVAVMGGVLRELYRITQVGGWVAFEVGEVKRGEIKLEESVIPLGLRAGFRCKGVVINSQKFTKTANIWGVNNMGSGTNTNRIVLFYRSEKDE